MLEVATWVPPLRELLLYCRRCSFWIYFMIMLLRAPQLEAAATLPKLRDKFCIEFYRLIACCG